MFRIVVDVVEIGDAQRKIGEVLKIKPLAALAMIDEGELDWKIVAISLDDPKAHLVNDVDDVEKHFPVRAKPILICSSVKTKNRMLRPDVDFVFDTRVH